MITKEILQALLLICPDGYSIKFKIKAAEHSDLQIEHVAYWHFKKEMEVTLCDENNHLM